MTTNALSSNLTSPTLPRVGAGCRNVLYTLLIERDLFGRGVLVRNWSQIGTNGREFVEEFASET
jgi:hypothetical protein